MQNVNSRHGAFLWVFFGFREYEYWGGGTPGYLDTDRLLMCRRESFLIAHYVHLSYLVGEESSIFEISH